MLTGIAIKLLLHKTWRYTGKSGLEKTCILAYLCKVLESTPSTPSSECGRKKWKYARTKVNSNLKIDIIFKWTKLFFSFFFFFRKLIFYNIKSCLKMRMKMNIFTLGKNMTEYNFSSFTMLLPFSRKLWKFKAYQS